MRFIFNKKSFVTKPVWITGPIHSSKSHGEWYEAVEQKDGSFSVFRNYQGTWVGQNAFGKSIDCAGTVRYEIEKGLSKSQALDLLASKEREGLNAYLYVARNNPPYLNGDALTAIEVEFHNTKKLPRKHYSRAPKA